jgi:hypothetical protein
MFWSRPPACGQVSAPKDFVVLPFLSGADVRMPRHCVTSEVAHRCPRSSHAGRRLARCSASPSTSCTRTSRARSTRDSRHNRRRRRSAGRAVVAQEEGRSLAADPRPVGAVRRPGRHLRARLRRVVDDVDPLVRPILLVAGRANLRVASRVVSAASAPSGFAYRATHSSPKVLAVPAGSSELSEPKKARPWPSQAITGSPALAVRACDNAAYGDVSSG